MTPFDLGIRCDHFLSMAGGKGDVLRDIFVGIRGNAIASVKPWAEVSPSEKSTHFIHAADQAVMPGLVNGHTHLAMTLFRGLADDLPFSDWLYKYILPLEGKMVDGNFVEVGTEIAALECIRLGVTTVCDMYFFEERVAETLDRVGLRALVCEAITDFPTPDDKGQTGEGFRILDRMVDKYRGHSRLLPCVGPHAPYTCSDETLKKAKAYAEKNNLPLVIHVAETKGEVQDSLKKFGKTPVRRLYDLGLMGPKTVFAHCVHLNDEDMDLMASTQTAAIYNPESNMKLGSGVAPIPRYLKAKIPVGIGTDGAASNNDLSIFREMDSGAKIQKLTHEDNTAMTAVQMLNMATLGGARALGLGELIGSLEVGKRADLICIDLLRPGMQPVYNLPSQLVYSASGAEVETVICDGKILMEKGQIKTMNTAAVFGKIAEVRDKVQAALP